MSEQLQVIRERSITFEFAKALYVNRYTMEHKPDWAHGPRVDGQYYAPQYTTDKEWYDRTMFHGESDLVGSARHCYSQCPTWPLGQSLNSPFFPTVGKGAWPVTAADHLAAMGDAK